MSEAHYTFIVKTSDAYQDAGTNSYVYVQLTGVDAFTCTEWHKLDIPFGNDFEFGAVDTYHVKMKDVGMPTILRIKMKNWLYMSDEWLCNTIQVTKSGESVMFPIYSYIDDYFEVMEGSASLLQHEGNDERREMRRKEVERHKKEYDWSSVGQSLTGLPRHVNATSYDHLPRIFKRFTLRQNDIDCNRLKTRLVTVLGQLRNLFSPIESLEGYKKFSDMLQAEKAPSIEDWGTDEGQGWQLMNGTVPICFHACREIPPYFNVTNDDVSSLLREGMTLQHEIENNRLFISDLSGWFGKDDGLKYTVLPNAKRAYCAPAVCLLYINQLENMVPIAIQLEPNKREYLHISDGSHDWMLAKMHYRCSLTSYHEWISHFLHTHNIMEPVSVSLFRCLPKVHPVYKLLRPHLRTVSAINTVGRQVLLPASSTVAAGLAVDAVSLIRKGFKTFTWEDIRLPSVIEKKGLDIEKIPNCWYARDAMKLWKIMENYSHQILQLYYKSDQDVVDDLEVQDWAHDLAYEGIGWEDKNTRGFPNNFPTISSLVDFCTTIMFTNSVQHTAVNYGQFENYHFVPNSPAIMNLGPHKRGEGNIERILKSLPNPIQSAKSVAMAFGLSQFSDADEFLGEFREQWFVDKDAVKCQQVFQNQLNLLQEEIEKRNANLTKKYNLLNPSRIPISIAI